MKTDTFLNAVGMIDDRFLDVDIPQKRIVRRKWKRFAVSAAAAALLIACPLPALTAFNVEGAYNVLYQIAPAAAQNFKPVQKSCEDQGIVMTVISAKCSGSEAKIFLSMQDLYGVYPQGEWDLYDSYRIHLRRDMSAHCSFSEYDPETRTAYFVVNIQTMDGSEIPKSKVTYSVSNLLLGKIRSEGTIEGIDMNSIPYEPEMTAQPNTTGGYAYGELPSAQDYRFLRPNAEALCTPAVGASVMNIGYSDGALHILTKFTDPHHTDSHGHIALIHQNEILAEKSEFGFYYHDDAHCDQYMEQIIPVSYDILPECSLWGEFCSAEQYISGDWQITFPLE